MLDSLRQSLRLPDLRRRILYTIGILAVYRFAAHVPVPGVDKAALASLFSADAGAVGRALDFLDLLSGGALENFSVMVLGVYPYITASIIMQLLTPLIPSLEELSKEGEAGRNKITMWTYWLAIPLAMVQAVAQIALVNGTAATGATTGQIIAFGAGRPLDTLTVLVVLTAGTFFGLWLGERITEKGIGNGVSMLIFAGIVSGMPTTMFQVFNTSLLAFVAVVLLTIATVFLIVFVQEGHRRIAVQYGRQMRGQRVYGGQTTYIPLRVNSTGMIPLIFANSLLIFPAVIGGVLARSANSRTSTLGSWLSINFDPNAGLYFLVYFILVIVFTFFYTDVVFRQQNLHETLQRNGGFVPGIRPGRRTEEYLTGIMHRITLFGAVFLGVVAVLPYFAGQLTGLSANTAMVINATGLLIVVGVVLDTIKQLEAQLTMRHYEGFIR